VLRVAFISSPSSAIVCTTRSSRKHGTPRRLVSLTNFFAASTVPKVSVKEIARGMSPRCRSPTVQTWGILSDGGIKAALNRGDITISPFEPAQLNAASYDVTLGDEVAVYEGWVETFPERNGTQDGRHFAPTGYIANVKDEPRVHKFKMDPKHGWVLKPGIGYLMHTRERVHTRGYVPVLDGKSSIGRLFVMVHVTAGYGDPGFDGQFTLEVKSTHPIRIYPGMRIGQIRFHTVDGQIENPYNQVGHYRGEHATGAVPSQAWRQFKRDG
jgi:dCTP deaminase